MVLKRSKHNVNSGNTFCFGRNLHYMANFGKNYITKSLVSKTLTSTPEENIIKKIKSLHEDGLYIQEQIPGYLHRGKYTPSGWFLKWTCEYSLDKRKRWLLPEEIKNEILQEGARNARNSVQITLVKSVKACDTVFTREKYYDSMLQNAKVIPKSDTKRMKKQKLKEYKAKKGNGREKVGKKGQSRGIQRKYQIDKKRDQKNEEQTEIWRKQNLRETPEKVKIPENDDEILEDDDEILEDDDEILEVHYEVCLSGPLLGHPDCRYRHDIQDRNKNYHWNTCMY